MSQICFDEQINNLIELEIMYNPIDAKNGNRNLDPALTEIHSLVLMIIQDCNLACSYCYGDGGQYNDKGIMTLEIARRSIDYLVEHCGAAKNVTVVFFGGEPLLNLELIKQIMPYIKQKEIDKKIKIYRNITSNGTLLNEEIEKYLIDNKIGIKISIDGCREINDKNRYYVNGEGVYDQVIRNTENLRKNGLVSARGTITPAFLNTESTIQHLRKLKFKNVGVAYADNFLKDEDYLRVFKSESEIFQNFERDLNNGIDVTNKYDRVKSYLKTINKSKIGRFCCGAGRKTIAIDRSGNIFPCHRFVGESAHTLGNIFDDHFNNADFLNEVDNNNHDNCSECWIKNLCLGKCPYVNYALTGDLKKTYPLSCILTRALFEEAVGIYLRLDDNQKKNLDL